MTTIRNPLEWTIDQVRGMTRHLGDVADAVRGDPSARPTIGAISFGDLRDALRRGVDDIAAFRSDVVFLCIIYPIVGLTIAAAAFHYQFLPLLFPAASGFALVGPFAAVGLYELSRRRERGQEANWAHALGVFASPSFGAIVALGLVLLALFVVWMVLAQHLYVSTLGPEPPASLTAFAQDVISTTAGWTMIAVGVPIGAVFALIVLSVSLVSFPMLLDRDVGLRVAVATSLEVVRRNPWTALAWGAIVVGLLVLGSLPAFLGLVFVLPLLGHATWHLYRRAVLFEEL